MRTASPGAAPPSAGRARSRRRAHGRNRLCPSSAFASGAIASPTRMAQFDAGRLDRLGELGVIARPICRPARASRRAPRSCGPARRAEHRQRRAHRGGVGVVALVDHQRARRSPTGDRKRRRAPRARPSRPARVPPARGRRRPHRPPPAPPASCDTQCSPGCEMVKLSSRSPTRAVTNVPPLPRRIASSARDIGALVQAEGDDPRRRAAWRQRSAGRGAGCRTGRSRCRPARAPGRSRPWRRRSRSSSGKKRGVRRRDRGDHRDMRAHQRGQMRELAGDGSSPSRTRRNRRVARHPRQAQRHAGMVVVALDRAMRDMPGRAVERGEQALPWCRSCPTDPVTPMIFAVVRARDAAPSASSAANVSPTRTCGCGVAWTDQRARRAAARTPGRGS